MKSTDPWFYIGNFTSFLSQKDIPGAGLDAIASYYRLARTVGIIGVAIGILLAGLKIASASNGKQLHEGKDELVSKVVYGALIFGSVSLLGFIMKLAIDVSNGI